MPVPKDMGGVDTVWACRSCHDMKDRFQLGDWPVEWLIPILDDMAKVGRETRLFLAKSLAIMYRTKEGPADHRPDLRDREVAAVLAASRSKGKLP
jgi:hypothetical protein